MYLSLYLSLLSFLFGQVMSPHHFDQMSQRLQVSGFALWMCFLNVFVFIFVFVFGFVFVIVFFWSSHVSSSLWSIVSKVTSLQGRSLKVLSKCICLCHCHCLCLCLCRCIFLGQVMSPHHYDQMCQGSQVSRIALWRCSLNVFVIVIVFVFVFVFVIVFFWPGHVSSSLWSNVSKVKGL